MRFRIWMGMLSMLFGSVWLFMAAHGVLGDSQPPPPFEGKGQPGDPPPFGPRGPGGPGGPGGFMGQKRKVLKQFDKDGDGILNKVERQSAREFLKKSGPGSGRGGFGPGGRGGFGPENFITKPLLQALDADQDGQVTKEELAKGVKLFFMKSDKEETGSLDEAKIAESLNGILPQPQGFPGGPPGGAVRFGPGNFLAGAVVRRADADKDGKVTFAELSAAADALFKESDKKKTGKLAEAEFGAAVALLLPTPQGIGRPGFGGRGNREPAKPGLRVTPADASAYLGAGLYDPAVLRTLFIEFENKDWEAELAEFRNTDVEVPAVLIVDGKKYPNVGVHFRGMSSYMMIPAGYKRSLNLSLDLVDKEQRLLGYKTLNLLNLHDDAAYMSTVLYSHIARQYMPAPKANLVKVVINGENWGIYSNAQQFDKVFLAENFKSTKGTRWKVRGSPGGGGGLDYVGDNVEDYKRRYEIKSADDPKAWKALIALCKTLSETPPDKLEKALAKIIDIDSLLWFLALDVALINDDGYWIRASDYCLFLDNKGKFHIVPHDMNEAFRPAGGPGFGGPGGFFAFPGGGDSQLRIAEILHSSIQETLQLTAAQKKQLADLQKDVDGKLAKILTADQNRELRNLRDRGPGERGRGPEGPDGPRGARGRGPGPDGPGERGPGGRGGRGQGGPGFGGPGGGVDLDPLIGLNDTRKPLRSKVLAVPALRTKYLQHVRRIAETSLDWKNLGPVVARYRKLIEKEVEADTHKLDSFVDFRKLTADEISADGAPPRRGPGAMQLRAFADQRRKYLLNNTEIKKVESSKPEAAAPKKDKKTP